MLSNHYKRHKYQNIYRWKSKGVISNDFDKLYEEHMKINICQLCNIQFNDNIYNNKRCLDHDHETGLYRQTICHRCNVRFDRKIDKLRKDNKSGHKNISYFKIPNLYIYRKTINKKITQKHFKTLKDALVYKFIQILKNNYQKNLDHFAR